MRRLIERRQCHWLSPSWPYRVWMCATCSRGQHEYAYSICLWVLDTGWLTLYPICIAKRLEVKFEFASAVIYFVSTTWISTKPGLIHLVTDLSGTLVKVGFCYLSVCIKCYLFTFTLLSDSWYFHYFKPACCGVDHG